MLWDCSEFFKGNFVSIWWEPRSYSSLCSKHWRTFVLKMPGVWSRWHGPIRCCFHFFLRFCLFIFREGKRGRKRGKEISVCGCLSHALHRGLGPQPRHVPWLEIEQATSWFAGWHSVHLATPSKANILFLICWGNFNSLNYWPFTLFF